MSGLIGALQEAVLDNPLDALSREEIELEIIKFSSFCSIIHNKKLNNVTVFSLIIKNKTFKKVFMKLTQIDNDREAVLVFLKYNSNLCRSKVVKDLLQSL